MYKVRIASYKNSKSFFAKLIRFKQRYINKLEGRYSRISHSEIVFCYNDNKEVLKRLKRIENIYDEGCFSENNLWFSSSEVDGGTRFKAINDNKNNWVYYDIEVKKEDYLKMLDFAIRQQGQKYGWFGIVFSQALGVNWFRRKNSWFCSQITLATLQEVKMFCGIDAINISPGELAELGENNI